MVMRLYEVTVTRTVYVVAENDAKACRVGSSHTVLTEDCSDAETDAVEVTCVPAEVSDSLPWGCPDGHERRDWTIEQWLEAIAKDDATRAAKADARQLTIPGAKL